MVEPAQQAGCHEAEGGGGRLGEGGVAADRWVGGVEVVAAGAADVALLGDGEGDRRRVRVGDGVDDLLGLVDREEDLVDDGDLAGPGGAGTDLEDGVAAVLGAHGLDEVSVAEADGGDAPVVVGG